VDFPPEFTEQHLAVLAIVRFADGASAHDVAEALGVPAVRASEILQDLEWLGLVASRDE
jgi:DNA-binding IclR family transcriptional regulator